MLFLRRAFQTTKVVGSLAGRTSMLWGFFKYLVGDFQGLLVLPRLV